MTLTPTLNVSTSATPTTPPTPIAGIGMGALPGMGLGIEAMFAQILAAVERSVSTTPSLQTKPACGAGLKYLVERRGS